jgi:hypothetical protein
VRIEREEMMQKHKLRGESVEKKIIKAYEE